MLHDKNEIGKSAFHFSCHADVSCFLRCCRQLTLYLYPYDILCLKKALKISSSEFVHQYTYLAPGVHSYFPSVLLQMSNNSDNTCPFLQDSGCSIYRNRPSACRTYPLERAVEKESNIKRLHEHYYVTRHDYCKGHCEQKINTVTSWIREQQLYDYNLMNDLWAEVDSVFASNPWKGEGNAGPLQQMAFMVCYNIDDFREYVNNQSLLRSFIMEKDKRHRIERSDVELLKFGFEWLQYILAGTKTLYPR